MDNFLNQPFSQLGMPKLAKWAEAPTKTSRLVANIKEHELMGKMHGGFVLDPKEITLYLEGMKTAQCQRPQTVAQFIQQYHWHIPSSVHPDRKGLSDKTLQEFMNLVRHRGLTSDDWPLLAGNQLFQKVSKEKLKEMPIGLLQVFRIMMCNPLLAQYIVSVCGGNRTQYRTFDWINAPLRLALENFDPMTGVNYGGKRFIVLLDKLHKAGFDKRDGKMVGYYHKNVLFKKALLRLKKYPEISVAERRKFAKILVRERLIK